MTIADTPQQPVQHTGPGRCQVHTTKAPAPIGPYSQAIAAQGPFIYTSGQIALDPETGNMVGTTTADQTRQCFHNLMAVLEAGGTNLSNIVKTTVFLADINDFSEMNEVYAEFFRDINPPPARSCIEVARLPKQARVEIEAIAWHS